MPQADEGSPSWQKRYSAPAKSGHRTLPRSRVVSTAMLLFTRKTLVAVACVLALAACASIPSAPELFGPGTISTPENELNAAFSPDGGTLYFTRAAGANGRFGVIVVSEATRDGRWSDPEVAEFSGHYPDYDPIVSPDGARLFFISKRPASGNEPRADFDIWVVERAGNGWGEPRNLGAPVNSDGDELYPSAASDGTLYFSSCGRKDSRGRCDLYRSRLRDGQYLEPENLGEPVNTPASETERIRGSRSELYGVRGVRRADTGRQWGSLREPFSRQRMVGSAASRIPDQHRGAGVLPDRFPGREIPLLHQPARPRRLRGHLPRSDFRSGRSPMTGRAFAPGLPLLHFVTAFAAAAVPAPPGVPRSSRAGGRTCGAGSCFPRAAAGWRAGPAGRAAC